MNRLLCAAVIGLMAGAPAMAADYPAATASYYDWTGAYFGAHTGYVAGEVSTTADSGLADYDQSYDLEFELAGVQFGYNHQVSSNFVVGFQVDASFSDADEQLSLTAPVGAVEFRSDLDWLATARLRVGYAFDNLLIFGTVGGAAAETDDRLVTDDPAIINERRSRKGWTAGGGFEWGFSENWSAVGEYQYIDLGEETIDESGGALIPSANSIDFEHIYHLGRVGVNYRF